MVDEFVHDLRDRGISLRLGCEVERVELDEHGLCREPCSTTAGSVRTEMVLFAAGRIGATDALGLDSRRPRGRRARPPHGRPEDLPDQRAAHLRRRRRHRLSEPRLDLDGAGPHRRLPRLRRAGAAAAGVLSLRHLFGAGDLDRRHDRGAGRARRASPTSAASRASARPRAATSWACIAAS